jgi:L-fuconolactonase
MPAPNQPTDFTVVDAHHHLWDLAVRPQPFLDSDPVLAPLRRVFSLADLAPLAAAAGVGRTVVVQTVTEPAETTELLALADAGGLIAAVVGWADLTDARVGESLASLRAAPGGQFLAGIRHPLLTEPDPLWLSRPDVRRGLDAVAAAGLVFDLVLPPELLPAAVRAAADVPDLTFVLDHLGNVDVTAEGSDAAWARSFRALAALPNVVCKLSGILGEATADRLRPYAEIALEGFGPERLMFGSDWPVSTLTAGYGDVVAAARALTAGLTAPDRAAVLAGTARAVYRIPE